ncbi:MAG: NAD(P)-dependent alcohol dehydrogenase [Gaiellaceae bacterium]
MKAIVHARYGRPPAALELRDVERPDLAEDQVLVRVHASSVNPVEWYTVTGPFFTRPSSGLRRPKRRLLGGDVAGRIEAVGENVGELQPGDEVFGISPSSWGEYAPARPRNLASKPPNVSFEEAAAVPIAGVTALQALRDHGRVEAGQRVLINGASGGVGTYAVQLAKALGAEVTAVCSTRNVDQAAELGADRTVDYTQEDFTRLPQRHNLLLDIAGRTPLSKMARVLAPDAKVILVGGILTYRGVGPLPHLLGTQISGKVRRRTVKSYVAKVNHDDLAFLAALLESGKLKSVIERQYPLEEAPQALAHLGEGHAQGKIVITT